MARLQAFAYKHPELCFSPDGRDLVMARNLRNARNARNPVFQSRWSGFGDGALAEYLSA